MSDELRSLLQGRSKLEQGRAGLESFADLLLLDDARIQQLLNPFGSEAEFWQVMSEFTEHDIRSLLTIVRIGYEFVSNVKADRLIAEHLTDISEGE